MDDVINVSGHRVGTAEVEAALTAHGACVEAAVVGCDPTLAPSSHGRPPWGVLGGRRARGAGVRAGPEAEAAPQPVSRL